MAHLEASPTASSVDPNGQQEPTPTRPRAEWLVWAVLAGLLGWKATLLLNPEIFTPTKLMPAWVKAGCFLQDVVVWLALVAGVVPLLRRYPHARWASWLAIVLANAVLFFAMVDARCKLLFMQPLTWKLLFATLKDAATLYSSLPFFLGKKLWIIGLATLAATNAAMFLGPRVGARVAWLGTPGPGPRVALGALAAAGVTLVFFRPQPYHVDDNMFAAPIVGAARAPAAPSGPDVSANCDEPARLLSDDDLASAKDPAAALARGRNVVLFLAESMSWRETSFGAPEANRTPFLRELAADAPIATSCRPQIAMSTKGIYSVLTGRYASPTLEVLESLVDGIDGLPRQLRSEGYYTTFISTQYLSWQNVQHQYEAMGFEQILGGREMLARAKAAGRKPMGNSYGIDDMELDKGVIDTLPRDRPFLAIVYTSAPHHPYRYDEQPESGTYLNRYRRQLTYTDGAIRAVVEAIKKRGQYESTLFVALGDHGEHFTDGGSFTTRGCTLTEDELKIPLVFAVPGAPRVHLDVQGARQIDIVPTILDLLGKKPRAPVQGRSLLVGHAPPVAYFDGFGVCDVGGYYEGDTKYVYDLYLKHSASFDLASDPLARRELPLTPDREQPLLERMTACRQYNERALRSLIAN